MEKIITQVEAWSKSYDHIRSIGERRDIKIHGTKGAGFSIEINDSSGYCILEEPLKDIEIPDTGVYILKQAFPSITTGFKEEYYEINVTAHADVRYASRRNNIKLYQYPDTTVTLATSTSQTGPALTVSGGSDITVTKPAYFEGEVDKTQTLRITENPDDTAGYLYVKDNFNNSISKNTTFKRVITTKEEPKLDRYVILKPSTTVGIGSTVSGTVTKGSQNYPITGDIEPGMRVSGKITKDKVVHKSLEVPTCQRATDKFELSDTIGLFAGMKVKVDRVGVFIVVSVDCGKNITVDRKAVIQEGTTVTFYYEIINTIGSVQTQINEDGNACVTLTTNMIIADGMVLDLDKDTSKIKSRFSFAGSGTNEVVITNNITFSKFGKTDATHTLDLDNIITTTPNIKNIKVNIAKNSGENNINTKVNDYDASAKTVSEITAYPKFGGSNAGARKGTRSVFYTPPTDFVGTDRILYKLSDGTNTSAEGRIDITVK